jgi:hypothetical protein
MSKLELQIRHMHTGKTEIAELPSLDDALAWLAERPQFVQVTKVRTRVPESVETRLREAMRPLDAAEKALQRQQDEAAEAARRAELERMQAEAEAETASAGGAADREMELRFTRGEGLVLADPSDTREITEAARRAALAWLRERESWVHPRRQHVAAATLRVWPASVPSGNESDRVLDGDFAAMPGVSDVEI